MLMEPQVLRMLEYQDSVSHHDTDQANNAQDARQAEIDMERPQAQRRPEQGEQQRGQGRQRQADLLEIDQQEEENNDHGDRQALHQRVHRLEIQLLGSTVLVRHALGQGRDNTAFHDSLDPFLHSVLVGLPGYLGEDAQGTHAVATDDLPIIPASLDRGDLPERDAHAGDDGGKILVADLIERVTLPFLIGSQLDRQSVIAFPEGANRETVVTDRQIGRGHRLRDPEAGGFHWVQSNPYVG